MPSSISVVELRRRALVVDGERAAAVGDGAVVDDGDAGRGDALAHQAGEGALLLAVEVALEPVADRLVQQDARPAGAEHDVEGAGRRRHRVEIDQRLAQRLVDGALPHVLGDEAARSPRGRPCRSEPVSWRSPSPTTTETLTRTSGRTSRTSVPSARTISTSL